MRLFSRVFFSIMLILSLALALSGTLLMTASFHDAMNREVSRAVNVFQATRFSLQSALNNRYPGRIADTYDWEDLFSGIHATAAVSVFSIDGGDPVYTQLPAMQEQILYGDLREVFPFYEDQTLYYETRSLDEATYLTVSGTFYAGTSRMVLMTSSDESMILAESRALQKRYAIVYGIVCGLGLVVTALFTRALVQPVVQMADAAGLIAAGDYAVRVRPGRNDELGDLSKSFNHMAEQVETSVAELTRNAMEKEDFVGNFAHELKTPLTSVIGYADMLAQKSLSEKEVKTYARYILDEGMRLEALSYKLMELIVLNRQDFVFEELPAKEIFENIKDSMRPMMEEHQVEADFETEEIDLRVEFDLFKTMMLNLVDNAVKAGAKRVVVRCGLTDESSEKSVPLFAPISVPDKSLTGNRHFSSDSDIEPSDMHDDLQTDIHNTSCCGRISISVIDDGRGIPEEALERITEAFYMVDKSRSRAQHGAGLGLALVKRIADLHGMRLSFESTVGVGTRVTLEEESDEDET